MRKLEGVNYFLSSKSHLYGVFHVLDHLFPKNKTVKPSRIRQETHLALLFTARYEPALVLMFAFAQTIRILSDHSPSKEGNKKLHNLAPGGEKLIRVVWVWCKDSPDHEAQHLHARQKCLYFLADSEPGRRGELPQVWQASSRTCSR